MSQNFKNFSDNLVQDRCKLFIKEIGKLKNKIFLIVVLTAIIVFGLAVSNVLASDSVVVDMEGLKIQEELRDNKDMQDNNATNDGKRIVKVGWFYSPGVHNIGEGETPSGYDYEYLQAISQYTNWEYAYVKGTWAECFEWLKNGEIDLLNVVNKTPEREKIFDYSYTSAGTEMCCLFIDIDNLKYAYQDFNNFNGMVVGIEEGTFQQEVLAEYAQQNSFTYSTVVYPTLAEACIAVSEGKIDAVLASNTDVISGYKAIAQFNPIPFYFATTKGNTELLSELNNGMNSLMTYYPDFSSDLYSKYYSGDASPMVVFTEDELNFIKETPEINVMYDPNWRPIEYYDEKQGGCAGIVPDLLALISQKTGLVFNFQNSGNVVDLLKEMSAKGKGNKGEENSITSISFDYKWAEKNNVEITQPFMDSSIMYVTKAGNKDLKTVALVDFNYITEKVRKLAPDLEPTYFENFAECIEAVYKGEVDCTYSNSCETEYYMTVPRYRDLSYHTTNLFSQKLCIGISENSDPRLFTIISKCLQSIPDSEIKNMVYNNSYHVAHITIQSFIKANPMLFFLIALVFVLLVFVATVMNLRSKIKASMQMSVEHERYQQLAEMTGEHLYEYNYITDTLSFNNASVKFFDCFGGLDVIENYKTRVDAYVSQHAGFENTIYSCFFEKKDGTKDINLANKEMERCWYRVITKIIKDPEGKPIYAIGKIQNVQYEHEERESLIASARHDGLTGIYNAKAFGEIANSSIMEGSTLLIIDADYFKSVNDRYGHYAGDKVLIKIAQIIKGMFEGLGVTGRIGGDEFAVFISERVERGVINERCEKLLKEICNVGILVECYSNNSTHIEMIEGLTVSIGGAFAASEEKYKELYKRADSALYKVKRDSRNGYRIL